MIDAKLAEEIYESVNRAQLANAIGRASRESQIGDITYAYYEALRTINILTHNGDYYWFDGKTYIVVKIDDIEQYLFIDMKGRDIPSGVVVKYWRSIIAASIKGVGWREMNVMRRKLAFKNCVLDVDTRQIFDFSPDHHVINKVDYDYVSTATCPKWNQFLREVLPDVLVREALQEFLGLIFVDRSISKIEQMLILFGTGSNGKSVIYETITSVIGRQNATNYEIDDLVSGASRDYKIADIDGKILNYCTELNDKELMSSRTKSLISGEAQMAREPYGKPFKAKDIPMIICNANALPPVSDHSKGYFRRHLIIPFEVEITADKQNLNLHTELRDELSGILNWILEGHSRMVSNGYKITEPPAIQLTKNKYILESNSVLMFLSEQNYAPAPFYAGQAIESIAANEFYNRYKSYCLDTGSKPFSMRRFGEKLIEKAFVKIKSRNGMVYRWYATPFDDDYDDLASRGKINMSRKEFRRLIGYDLVMGSDASVPEIPEIVVYDDVPF